ncbi:hypothetical protein AS590_26020 [Prescottella equi]|nr:hypothetical protein AS590_26020 [Prescottella equi]
MFMMVLKSRIAPFFKCGNDSLTMLITKPALLCAVWIRYATIENVLLALVPPWMIRRRRLRLLIFVSAVVCWSSAAIVVLHYQRRWCDAGQQRYWLVFGGVIHFLAIFPTRVVLEPEDCTCRRCSRHQKLFGVLLNAELGIFYSVRKLVPSRVYIVRFIVILTTLIVQ